MNKAMLAGVLTAAAFIVAGGVYLVVPSLQSPRALVDADVAGHVERARRLLDRVGANHERLAVVLDGLGRAQVQNLDDELIDDLVEENPQIRDLLDDAQDRLQGIYRENSRRQGDLSGRLAEAGGDPVQPPSSNYGTNVGQMATAIRTGLAVRDELLGNNQRLLDAAAEAVREAAAVQHGDVSGGDDPAVLRMQGMVQYAQGTALHRQARLLRDRAHDPRRLLQTIVAESARRAGEQRIVQDSQIDARVAEARESRERHQTNLAALQASIATLTATVADMETALTEQQTMGDQARQILDALADEGFDFADPQGFETFSVKYAGQSQIYREALSAALVLEFGTLDNAVIDRSGDHLLGDYLPADGSGAILPRRGLFHYRAELAELEEAATQQAETVAAVDTKIEELQQTKANLTAQAARSEKRADVLGALAADAYHELIETLDQAWELEEQAIASVNTAARSFRAAAQQAGMLAREAGEAVAGLSPEASALSAKTMISQDDWPAAGNAGREADAQLRLAAIYYDRYRDLSTDSGIVASLAGVLDTEEAEDLGELADEARAAGLAAAEQALEGLFKTSRRLDQHFSLTAQIGSTYYLQAMFGREELVAVAIENFVAAVEGREDSPYVRQYLERLDQLRRRSE